MNARASTAPLDALRRDLAELERGIASRVLPDPAEWAARVAGVELDPWQQALMVSNHPALLLLTSRQVGKSFVVALRAAYRAKYLGRRVGVLSPTLRQSSIVYRRAKGWLQADGETSFARQTLTELELNSGGTVVAFPGDRPDLSIRGFSLDDLIIDEASRIKDDLIAAATPTTATSATANITYLSSPAGQRGAFYRAFTQQPWWHKVTVMAQDCRRISPEFLARERERLGDLYAQEFCCAFLLAPGGVLHPAALARMFDDDGPVEPDVSWGAPAVREDEREAW